MKIGIISINLYSKWLNLACPLHSYAMQEFLTSNGYDCKVIDYKASYYDDFDMRHPSDYYREKYQRKLSRFPADEKKRTGWFENIALIKKYEQEYDALYHERESRYDKVQSFIDTRLNVTKKGYNSASLEFENPGFDCYMCVTDVIWKSEPSLERAFFLANKCMDNKIKIAYSASRGSSHTRTQAELDQFFDYLEDFNAISVREPSLKEHISEHSDLEATVVLDPVMLHDRSFYDKIAQEPEEKKYMFLYHVVQDAEDTIEQAVKYAKAHNLTIIESSDRPYPEGKLTKYEGIEHKWIYDIGIEQWLGYIRNAECVFTNSFHCCCLSILFGKNFFAGLRNGDKVDTVLSTFGLENRRFDMDTDILANDPGDIDYERVHAILEEKREESGSWLLNALEKAKGSARYRKDYASEREEIIYPIFSNFNLPNDNLTAQERIECSPKIRAKEKGKNNGKTPIALQKPSLPGYRFLGWSMRCRIDNEFYRYTKDEKFEPWKKVKEQDYKLFSSKNKIPHIPANGIVNVTFDAVWKKLIPTFAIILNSGLKSNAVTAHCNTSKGELYLTKGGTYEYRLKKLYENGTTVKAPKCPFSPTSKDKSFLGWKIRFWIDTQWYWCMTDGSFAPTSEISGKDNEKIKVFLPGQMSPELPEGAVSNVIFCACWSELDTTMAYHSGTLKADNATCSYDDALVKTKVTDKGAFECLLNEKISNDGTHTFEENGFIPNDGSVTFGGWYLRIKDGGVWKWYLESDVLIDMSTYNQEKHGKRRVFLAGEQLINLNIPEKTNLVAVATWKKT